MSHFIYHFRICKYPESNHQNNSKHQIEKKTFFFLGCFFVCLKKVAIRLENTGWIFNCCVTSSNRCVLYCFQCSTNYWIYVWILHTCHCVCWRHYEWIQSFSYKWNNDAKSHGREEAILQHHTTLFGCKAVSKIQSMKQNGKHRM